jgi:hypothetical protein
VGCGMKGFRVAGSVGFKQRGAPEGGGIAPEVVFVVLHGKAHGARCTDVQFREGTGRVDSGFGVPSRDALLLAAVRGRRDK